jgi:hypothetical protein
MMRLPIPAILAALVAVAAGSVLVNVYLKSDAAYVLDVSDIPYMQNKTFVLDYMPHRIQFISNVSDAWYDAYIYVNGRVNVEHSYRSYIYWLVCDEICTVPAINGSVIYIKPVDVRDTKVKIVVVRTWPP